MRSFRHARARFGKGVSVLLTLAALIGFAVAQLTLPGAAAATLRPTFVAEAETAWNSSTSPKTTPSFNVLAGDVLIAYALQQNSSGTLAVSGGSLAWTPVQSIDVGAFGEARI